MADVRGKMTKIVRFLTVIVVLLLSPGVVVACSPGNAAPVVSKLTDSEVRVFADPIAENLLQAMNTANYTQYTCNFDEAFLKNLSPDTFEALNSRRIETVGNYVSKEYWRMVQKNDKITVAYQVTFTGDSTVIFTIYFKSIDGKWCVDGVYYDSALLRKSGC